ncbi:PqiC family protein [Cognaticolwellia beringensis]|uniref:ABC-type transport auxiliary lipoprotein component domain-containing protein n=1 Tax=Cognaticolwellia beringensis TaxID=1967665 RepID=A0A222G615_9GAMM|nr:ABC-type transport auxiliary lipoprotein family protein [Cognaticolwellia beringensis]ASP47336.1 hypothetical protein B5D82_05895 [Cognaticolwellia beringensis]
MKPILIASIVSIILLTACSANTPQKTQYYLLNSPTSTSTAPIHNKNNQNIAITLIELPDYLKQPSLVLQLSSHQLHYSHFHMWAEPLQSSFLEALSQDLNDINSRVNYISTEASNHETSTDVVFVKVSAFHATHQSQAILTGTFWLQDKDFKGEIAEHNFNLTVALNQDGYEHAVEQMRKSVGQLAKKIANTLAVE